jgi:hypothetical protein
VVGVYVHSNAPLGSYRFPVHGTLIVLDWKGLLSK